MVTQKDSSPEPPALTVLAFVVLDYICMPKKNRTDIVSSPARNEDTLLQPPLGRTDDILSAATKTGLHVFPLLCISSDLDAFHFTAPHP